MSLKEEGQDQELDLKGRRGFVYLPCDFDLERLVSHFFLVKKDHSMLSFTHCSI